MGKYKAYKTGSFRLKEYDYSNNGAYFITIVTKNMQLFFGKVDSNSEKEISVFLTGIGEIAQKYWNEIPKQFPFIKLDEMIVMPNHIHGILWIDGEENDSQVHIATIDKGQGGITGDKNPMFHENISRVIRWYKGRCTFEINKLYGKSFFAWQSLFHDRIIRNDAELNRIREYIIENPKKWILR